MIEPGTEIGKLRVERIIGRGGMGVVAIATHVQLGQRVAIKVAHDELASDPAYVERFVREARACASLRSEHACKVSDVGQLPSGAPYIVMELLEGSDLAACIRVAPLALPVAADYVLQACIAVAEAHALGIVHRDLKPSNLFLARRLDGTPLVKVLDFGIAKAPPSHDLGLTNTAAVLGSPRYMSPEQLRSARDVDARTDIWALGVILYELVSGRVPFPATSLTEAAVKVAMDEPDPLDADPAYVRVVMRCLEKSAGKRYPDVGALAADLAPFAPSGTAHAQLIARLLRREVVPEVIAPRVDAHAPTASTAKTAAESATLREQTTLQGASGAIPAAAPPARRRGWMLALATVAVAGGVVAIGVRGRGGGVVAGDALDESATGVWVKTAANRGGSGVASGSGATSGFAGDVVSNGGGSGATNGSTAGGSSDAAGSAASVAANGGIAGGGGSSAANGSAGEVVSNGSGAARGSAAGVAANGAAGSAASAVGSAVTTAAVDAGVAAAVPGAPDPVARLRAKLREATANRDWAAALAAGGRLSHLGKLSHEDDTCCYAPASERFIREQEPTVTVQTTMGDCAAAAREANRIIAASKWDQAIATEVAGCAITAGEAAYASGNYAAALASARLALTFASNDRHALKIAAGASCQLKDPSAPAYAKKYLGDRDNFIAGCKF